MSNFEKKEEVDLQQKKLEGDLIYKINLEWLLEHEARNLGEKHLVRHGEVGVYAGWEEGNSGLPAGLPLCFGDKDFQKKFRASRYLEESLPEWRWSGEAQDLSDPIASDEKIEELMSKTLAVLRAMKGSIS